MRWAPYGDWTIVARHVTAFIAGGRGRPRHGRWPVEQGVRIGQGPDVCKSPIGVIGEGLHRQQERHDDVPTSPVALSVHTLPNAMHTQSYNGRGTASPVAEDGRQDKK